MDNIERTICITLPPEMLPPGTPTTGEATLTDQFAMAALTGLLSSNDVILNPSIIPDIIDASYNIADAMMVERADTTHASL